MKVYRIKTSEFKNLCSIESVIDKNIKSQVESVEKASGKKAKRILTHGKNLVLVITTDSKYLIVSKPCYQNSLVSILNSVGIVDSDIILYRKSTAPVELTVDQLKSIILEK